MSIPDLRLHINLLNEAYDGEITLKQVITRNQTQYGAEADRMTRAGGMPPSDYPQLKTAADLMNILHVYVDELDQSLTLKSAPALTLLSKLKSMRLNQTSKQLDQITKLPAPKEPGKP